MDTVIGEIGRRLPGRHPPGVRRRRIYRSCGGRSRSRKTPSAFFSGTIPKTFIATFPFIPSAAEGSAVRPGSRTKVSVPLVLPQNRHPERSASRIYRLTEGFWRAVEGPRGCLLAAALHRFPATKTGKKSKKSQPPTEAKRSGGTCGSFVH